MSTARTRFVNPFEPPPYPIWRFSVADYHRLIESAVLGKDDRVELLEGWIVPKTAHNPPHDGTIQIASERLRRCLPAGWVIRIQSAITTDDSEPEPDLAVVRGDERTYPSRHPGPADIGLIVEVADSSLEQDLSRKSRIYARAGIPLYWVINLVEGQVETFRNPDGPPDACFYAMQAAYRGDDLIPLTVEGAVVARIRAAELLPDL